jgi:thioredoxin 1
MSEVIVYDVWAEWCGPCKRFAPIFDTLRKDPVYSELMFVKIEADLNPEFLLELGIRSIPTILITEDDKIVYQHAGILAEWQMRDILATYVGNEN